MGNFSSLAQRIEQALELETAPVAVSFADALPAGMGAPSKAVPAGCSFWGLGAKTTFATSAEHHALCSIGIHTHNLADAPATQSQELETALSAMQGLDYVRPNEVAALPVMSNSRKHVVYGPLSEAIERPDVVILFASASQSLIITEALARVDGETPATMGRPACAMIPQVLNSSRSVSSLGCCGARAYLEPLGDDVTLWALHGERLEDYIDALEVFGKANSVLSQFHEHRKLAVESGESPTVAQSLARLG